MKNINKTKKVLYMSAGERKLVTLRKGIDLCDTKILEVFKKRFQIASRIGEIKALIGNPVRDSKREKIVIQDRVSRGKEKNLSAQFVTTVWKAIFKEAYTFQNHESTSKKPEKAR